MHSQSKQTSSLHLVNMFQACNLTDEMKRNRASPPVRQLVVVGSPPARFTLSRLVIGLVSVWGLEARSKIRPKLTGTCSSLCSAS